MGDDTIVNAKGANDMHGTNSVDGLDGVVNGVSSTNNVNSTHDADSQCAVKTGHRKGDDANDDDDFLESGDVRKRRDAISTRDVDGGWAFVVFVVSSLIMAMMDLFLVQAGIFQLEFLKTFGGSRGYLAMIGSVFVCIAGILGPVSGALASRLTPRATMMLGGALMSLGMVSASFAESRFALFLTYGIINGVGGGLVYTPAATAYTAYFQKYRQIATGFVMAAPGVGLLTGPYMARWLLENHGWRFSMAFLGYLAAQICVLAALIFPAPVTSTQGTVSCLQYCMCTRTHSTIGNKMVLVKVKSRNGLSPSNVEKALLEDATPDTRSRNEIDDSQNSLREQLSRVLRSKLMWVMSLNQMLLSVGVSVTMLHLPSYVVSQGISFKHYPDIFMVYAITFMGSRISGGFFFNRFNGHLVAWMFGFEVAFALILGFLPLYGTTLPALFVFNFVVGLAYSPSYMLLTPVLIQYFGLKDLSVIFGVHQLAIGTGFFVGPPVAGLLYDFLGTYTYSFYFSGGTVAVGALLLIVFFCCPGDNRKTITMTETKIPT